MPEPTVSTPSWKRALALGAVMTFFLCGYAQDTLSPATRSGAAPSEPALFDTTWADLSDFDVDLAPAFIPEARAHGHAPIYHLDWVIESPTYVRGRAEVRIVNDTPVPWSDLWFHLLPNVLGGGIEVSGSRIDGVAVEPTLEREGELLGFELTPPLQPERSVVVAMEFAVTVPTGPQRNYSLLSYRDGILSLAHAYPILAVHQGDDGWDLDPPALHGDLVHARASWFRARMTAPSEWTLAASGVERVQNSEGTAADVRARTWTVTAGPVRDLYLSLGAYRSEAETVGGTTVRSFFLEGGQASATQALEHALNALAIFGARWTPYPYLTLDLVPLSTQALGIEFPGIIALAERLYAPDAAYLESTVVHEVAHQWFYGVVGNDQITDPWLDEALAQYAVWIYTRERYGDARADEVLQSFTRRWRTTDEEVPIGRPVTSYSPAQYGSVVYGRGPVVMVDLAEQMGEDVFDTFLRGYVAALRWGIATPDAFRRGAEAACACSLEAFFETSIEELEIP